MNLSGTIRALLLVTVPALSLVLAGQSQVKFADVTASLGIQFHHEASPTSQKYLPETMGSGVALLDYDGDGRLDIFLANGARIHDPMPAGSLPAKEHSAYWDRLYRQREDGTFDDVTETSGLSGRGYSIGVASGDYDNDGDLDLYVTSLESNTLYRNNGDGTFTDVTESAGVGGSGWSSSAAFVDIDHDGLLDLFVCRYLDWSFEDNIYCGDRDRDHRAYCHPDEFSGLEPLLYHNQGDGRFKDISRQAGLTDKGKALGIAIADFNQDGWIDIFVANDSVAQFLYTNQGDGSFEEVALLWGAALDQDGNTYAGMGADFADYDNDGWPDLIVTNLSNQRYALYRNRGHSNSFDYTTYVSGVGKITQLFSGWGVKFNDFDNDGWKDLFIAQGHVMDTIRIDSPHLRYLQPPLFLKNQKGEQFIDLSSQAGNSFAEQWAGRGLATGDLDRDGDLDVVITAANQPAHVLRNDGGNQGNWISLRLVGSRSNRDGIGAAVQVVSPAGTRQFATVSTTGSYLSAVPPDIHFGLGPESQITQIEIRWPSGVVQRLDDVAANHFLTVREPEER
ncbi:MAG: CRTAC1 family protein [Acidobacteriota bacterium]